MSWVLKIGVNGMSEQGIDFKMVGHNNCTRLHGHNGSLVVEIMKILYQL